jgi:ureidoacrylate peracid hydrolase
MKPLAEKVDPKQAALVVVDVQNDFCHHDGAMSKNGADVKPMQLMAPRLNRLIDQARSAGTPVVFVRATHSKETDSPVWIERHTEQRHYICEDGNWGAEWFEVSPEPGDAIVLKHRYSGFVGTNLDELLTSRGIRSVVLTGVVTNVCVESTARDAFMHDYFVVVVSDCTATSEAEDHEQALDRIGRIFGVVARADEVAACWAAPQLQVPAR